MTTITLQCIPFINLWDYGSVNGADAVAGWWDFPTALRMRGQTFEFEAIRCVVLESENWSETESWTSGGGGYLIKGTGQIEPTQTHSITHQRTKLWLRREDSGEELSIQPQNPPNCRAGHALSFVLVA